MSVAYKVGGMTCDGCANAISRAIEGRSNSTRALVDLKAGIVHVEGSASEEEVREAIEDAGFNFNGAA